MNKQALMASIRSNFSKLFAKAVTSLNEKDTSTVQANVLSFYRRWHYSALIEDTVLSPSFLDDALGFAYDKASETMSVPLPLLPEEGTPHNVSFTPVQYSLEQHPIINDLKVLLLSCFPDFELDDKDNLSPVHQQALLPQLSLPDPYYLEYLFLLCTYLGLVTKIPSIHVNRAQVTSEFEPFFEQPPREIFNQIMNAAISVATCFINEIIPINEEAGNSYILSLLKNPTPTDEIFQDMYAGMGIDLDELFEADESYMEDDFYGTMLSGTFYLGIVIDKYFFTPFGFYLRLIEPGYLLPYSLEREMEFVTETLDESFDLSIAVFAPCSHYTHTPLGRAFFGIKKTKADMPGGAKLNQDILSVCLKNSGLSQSYAQYLDGDGTDNLSHPWAKNVYQIKITPADYKAFWVKLEMLESNTLHDLYLMTCQALNLPITSRYTMYTHVSATPFSEYVPPNPKPKAKANKNQQGKITSQVTLDQLSLPEKHPFTLILHQMAPTSLMASGQKPVKSDMQLDLTIMKISSKKSALDYPRLKARAKAFKDQ